MAEVTINGETKGYDSFTEAMDAAQQADKATVTLLDTVTLDSLYTVRTGNVTLEGAALELILSPHPDDGLAVSGGILTVKNSGSRVIVKSGGTLVVSGSAQWSAVHVDGGVATLSGGEVDSLSVLDGSATVTGGHIDAAVAGGSAASIVIDGDNAQVDLSYAGNGGTIILRKGLIQSIAVNYEGVFNMHGGSVTEKLTVNKNNGSCHIYGGTITGTIPDNVTWHATGVSVSASGATGSTITMKPNGTVQLNASVTANGHADKVKVTWSSSDEAVATVNPAEENTVTVTAGTQTGTATITASVPGPPADTNTRDIGQMCSNGTCTATFTVKVEQESTPDPEPATRYTVTFDSNEGSVVESKTVESGSTVNEPTDPTRDGYTFAGWWTDETWTKQWDFTTDVVNANMTLYARWMKNEKPTPPTPSRPSYQGIRIVGKPSKNEYAVGEKLDLTGLEIREYWSDGSSRRLGASEVTVSGFDSSEPGERTVTVSLSRDKRYSVSFTVRIVAGEVTVYRLYDARTGEHFYTANLAERDHLTTVGWRLEGVAFTMATHGVPVYRLYAEHGNRLHMFTANKAERDTLITAGWRYEGVAWYEPEQGKTQVHRLYNERNGDHLHTTNPVEYQNLKNHGWRDEGISFNGK